jgi:quercetin dioxygenase-like cupin family protein
MQQAVAVRRLESEAVRVTEWQFQPGDATGHHRHDFEYVVVPLTGGTLRLVEAGGERLATLAPGVAYTRPAGVEHDVINAGDQYLAFVEIELKHKPG